MEQKNNINLLIIDRKMLESINQDSVLSEDDCLVLENKYEAHKSEYEAFMKAYKERSEKYHKFIEKK